MHVEGVRTFDGFNNRIVDAVEHLVAK